MTKCISMSVPKQTGAARYGAVGLDVSDRKSTYVAISNEGTAVDRGKVSTRSAELERWARSFERTLVVIEAGPHSPWISRLISRCGHEVVVANPAKIPSISGSRSKSDWRDAEQLARLGRFDRTMLFQIKHRSEQTQKDLQLMRSRDVVVGARTKLIGHVRGTGKSHGHFIPYCSSDAFVRRARAALPAEVQELVAPVLEAIDKLSEMIRAYDKRIEQLVAGRYSEAQWLTQVQGVGALTALAFILVLAEASRFRQSRMVGPYLGLVPARSQSGESDPQKGISKEGDRLMRKLLVHSAHYIMGPFGSDSDLRRHGERISARGGKNAKKRAAVAVARKLAVLLHHLWVTHQEYVPLFTSQSKPVAA